LGDLTVTEFGLLAQRKRDVLEQGHRIEQRRALKQHAKFLTNVIERALAKFGDVRAIYQDTTVIR
jgi:hypothetical protein